MFKYQKGILILLLPFWLNAQLPEQKLVPDDIDPGDFFGRYLCLKGNDLLVGAHQDDQNGYASGSVYAFEHSQSENLFFQIQKLLPADGNVEEFFGYSIAISGRLAIVGSHHDSDFGGSSGSAFLLTKDDSDRWSISQKLLPDDPMAGDEFGKAVGIAGNWIAAGAFLDDDAGTNAGSVYLFHWDGADWKVFEELYALDAQPYDQTGNFLALTGSVLLVGVPEKQTAGYKSGCSYVFEWNGTDWQQSAKLVPDDVAEGDEFGQAVASYDRILAIGAYKADAPLTNGGAVYLYQKSEADWEFLQKIVPPDNDEGDHFGSSVSLWQHWLAIGAYFDDDNGSKSGSVYLYQNRNGLFEFVTKIKASDGSAGDAFGSAVCLDSTRLAVGAYADSDQGFFSGSAYVFDLDKIVGLAIIHDSKAKTGQDAGIMAYPNPANNWINLECPACPTTPRPFRLINTQGTEVLGGILSAPRESLFIGSLPDGFYTLVVSGIDPPKRLLFRKPGM